MKNLIVLALALMLFFAGCSAPQTETPLLASTQYSFSCSVIQGFNFDQESQELVGFINYLKIGDTELPQDFIVTDPVNIQHKINVFGVISGIFWRGEYSDPVIFTAQVSNPSKNTLSTMLHKTIISRNVEFSFTVYEYDPVDKTYFEVLHSNSIILKGEILQQNAELALNVFTDQSNEVVSPKNYTLNMAVEPQDVTQQIYLAISNDDKSVKPWGVKAGQ